MSRAILALEDGRSFEGEAFGATGSSFGEACFNTSMTGYQEVLTDPSYRGQIVAMTYPMIGNYGINQFDNESKEPHVRGFVIEELCEAPSNWRSETSLSDYIVAYDFGIKHNILRNLRQHGFTVDVVNARTSAADVLAKNPDGVFLSNGPGDPDALQDIHGEIRELLGKVPIFGICLGHQILSHALGGKTFKLKFGHRGGNQPVKDLRTDKVSITSQNHGFAVDGEDLPEEVEITHINLNDNTVEGLRHKVHPAFSVQYHPEASPGPHDASYFFDEFAKLIEQSRVTA